MACEGVAAAPAARIPVLDDESGSAARLHAHAEARQLAIPCEHVGRSRLDRVNGALGELRHVALPHRVSRRGKHGVSTKTATQGTNSQRQKGSKPYTIGETPGTFKKLSSLPGEGDKR